MQPLKQRPRLRKRLRVALEALACGRPKRGACGCARACIDRGRGTLNSMFVGMCLWFSWVTSLTRQDELSRLSNVLSQPVYHTMMKRSLRRDQDLYSSDRESIFLLNASLRKNQVTNDQYIKYS